ncbi:hypothetical protein N5D61_00150 [Pseudomonas sp. GD03842]|uniref:hypothetical protein n=1 Tax=Pseudomonas sp. GD03842 TaxID=2975385 RepID=UPI00244B75C5|nr:hypothetical protein [Pseudomonas sp. GD03842]MDH0744762.1 hypothetical protein [Pseudomonas sp. GD03842]
MPKGFISKDYASVVFAAAVVAGLLLVVGLFARPSDWAGWIQAIGLIVGLIMAIAIPAIQRRQELAFQQKQVRDRETGYARRMQYLCGELNELLAKITVNLVHLRAADRHRLQRGLDDYLHRLFESHKLDQNDDRVVIAHELRLVANDLIEELESGRSDRVVLNALEKRLQKLAHRCQVNATMAERV